MDVSRIQSADMGELPDGFQMAPLPSREDVFGKYFRAQPALHHQIIGTRKP